MDERIPVIIVAILLGIVLFASFNGTQNISKQINELIPKEEKKSTEINSEQEFNELIQTQTNQNESTKTQNNTQTNNSNNSQTTNSSNNIPSGSNENPLSQECNYDSICNENENSIYCPEDCGDLPDLDNKPQLEGCPEKGKEFCE
jgi:cytoskeletal protein RodZ